MYTVFTQKSLITVEAFPCKFNFLAEQDSNGNTMPTMLYITLASEEYLTGLLETATLRRLFCWKLLALVKVSLAVYESLK